ncbi:PrgH/EprH family type III secretion apparatus protein [Escherichia coli]|nr:PrgH/EprH family type III secretion apparatus protein [Escherichia coli]
MSLWDALRMNMMISYQELVRTFPNNVYFNIIGTLSDSELNKINNYVDEYYKQCGKQYVRFNVNLKNQDTNNSSFSYGDNRFEKSQGSKWTFQE